MSRFPTRQTATDDAGRTLPLLTLTEHAQPATPDHTRLLSVRATVTIGGVTIEFERACGKESQDARDTVADVKRDLTERAARLPVTVCGIAPAPMPQETCMTHTTRRKTSTLSITPTAGFSDA